MKARALENQAMGHEWYKNNPTVEVLVDKHGLYTTVFRRSNAGSATFITPVSLNEGWKLKLCFKWANWNGRERDRCPFSARFCAFRHWE